MQRTQIIESLQAYPVSWRLISGGIGIAPLIAVLCDARIAASSVGPLSTLAWSSLTAFATSCPAFATALKAQIQIPVRVPRLGVENVRAYLFLLLFQSANSDPAAREKLRSFLTCALLAQEGGMMKQSSG